MPPLQLLSTTLLLLSATTFSFAAPPKEETLLGLQQEAYSSATIREQSRSFEPDTVAGPNPRRRHVKNEKKLAKNSLGDLIERSAKVLGGVAPVEKVEWLWARAVGKGQKVTELEKREPFVVIGDASQLPPLPTIFPLKDGVIDGESFDKRSPAPIIKAPGHYPVADLHRRRMEKIRRTNREKYEALTQRDTEVLLERDSDVEARAAQYPLSSTSGYFTGASSYYLFSLVDADRHAVLDALVDGGFKVVRIFVASVYAGNKGSNNVATPDLEPVTVGTYDDTILESIDQLMYDCSVRGLKLLIALHDRYALGFWATDAYALEYGIVPSGTSGVQQVSTASVFYTSSSAISAFNNRLAHIMSHQNALLGGKSWAELDSVIYALEPQNEPQGHMTMASSSWTCDRAAYLKTLLPSGSGILISSGGGITTSLSLGEWAMSCSSIDIISVHDYGTTPSVTVAALKYASSQLGSKKTVMLGEWGIAGSNKAATISAFVSALSAAGLPWMYWEVVKPGKAASDFEVWTDEPAWEALTGLAYTSSASTSTTVTTSTWTTDSESPSSVASRKSTIVKAQASITSTASYGNVSPSAESTTTYEDW